MTTRVVVDAELCALTGYCTRILPDVFTIEPGRPVVSVAASAAAHADPEDLDEAEATCPVRAIEVFTE